MNTELLQLIYQTYQPQQYYRKYFEQAKQRPDGRAFGQHRPLRISITVQPGGLQGLSGNCSVTISRGNTIVIVQISTNIQKVVYSPITQSYSKPLLTLSTSVSTSTSGRSRTRSLQSLESNLDQFINWPHIERQLAYSCPETGDTFAHVGTVKVRVAGDDGCVEETVLLGLQLGLESARFGGFGGVSKGKFKHNKQGKESKQGKQGTGSYSLELPQFWYPTKYSQILSTTLTDPTYPQQNCSNYQLTLLTDLKSPSSSPIRILKVHKNGSLPAEKIAQIQKLHRIELSKLPLNLADIRSKFDGTVVGDVRAIAVSVGGM